jgi:hypothetical protein
MGDYRTLFAYQKAFTFSMKLFNRLKKEDVTKIFILPNSMMLNLKMQKRRFGLTSQVPVNILLK